jgi:2-polyprenyl-3-methyl-5-hydroxy-6-metoxy-1,4-benzoquinol methylase
MERIYPTKESINKALDIRRQDNHIERYQIIKRYCFGSVLDIACGVGYGSYLLENNPDIDSITGVDIDNKSIKYANEMFKTEKIEFEQGNILNYSKEHDVMVSLETIEHISFLDQFKKLVERVNPKVLIISFPNKKSTHFNPFHKHDLTSQQVVELLSTHILVKQLYQHDITIMVFIKSPKGVPKDLFSSII